MPRRTKLTITVMILISVTMLTSAQSGDDIVSQRLEKFLKDSSAVSVNVALVKNGQITYKGAFGKVNLEKGIDATTKHQYMIGSVSKLFTGAAIMQLVEQGKIDLEEDINKYLPFTLRHPEYRKISITIKMLLTHTSSFADRQKLQNKLYVDGDSRMSLKDVSDRFFDRKGEFYMDSNFEEYQPGEKWDYSNWNYVLLGYIVERVTGMQYYEYSYKNILEPLEMHSSKWFLKELNLDDIAIHYQPTESGDQKPIDYYGWPGYPDGQLRSNVEEMSNFLIMYLNDGEFRGKRILTKGSISRILTTNECDGLTGRVFKGMGLTWFVHTGFNSVFSHGGSPTGTRIEVLIDKESNSGFVFYVTGVDEMKEDTWNKIKDLQLYLQEYAAGTE
jgi:CubicO group peptidase (beta-lactamase class C family)